MKTELKDILHFYLGCEMNVLRENGRTVDKVILNASKLVLIENNYYDGSEKLILYPLSDLIKEIEINGEKFVPLKKLHELLETSYFSGNKYCLKFVDRVSSIEHMTYGSFPDNFILKYVVPTSNMGDLVYSLTYAPDLRRFIIRDETNSRPLGIGYQLDLFLKLLEWKFDLFGLIDSGQAIDKNKV